MRLKYMAAWGTPILALGAIALSIPMFSPDLTLILPYPLEVQLRVAEPEGPRARSFDKWISSIGEVKYQAIRAGLGQQSSPRHRMLAAYAVAVRQDVRSLDHALIRSLCADSAASVRRAAGFMLASLACEEDHEPWFVGLCMELVRDIDSRVAAMGANAIAALAPRKLDANADDIEALKALAASGDSDAEHAALNAFMVMISPDAMSYLSAALRDNRVSKTYRVIVARALRAYQLSVEDERLVEEALSHARRPSR